MSEPLVIPEDLQTFYSSANEDHGNHYFGSAPFYNRVLRELIERIARLEAPVSDEEMAANAIHYMMLGPLNGPYLNTPLLTKSSADKLIATRSALAGKGGSAK
jgi:hypothetical protein